MILLEFEKSFENLIECIFAKINYEIK